MFVAELWRFPVKSMGGERLRSADIGPLGIPGDRVVHVENDKGRVITSRSRPRLLLHRGTLGEDGEPRVDGRPWPDDSVRRDVIAAVGEPARLVRDESPERFDVLPLLIATDGAIAAFGYDGRRLRPNIVVGGVAGLAERTWEGRLLHVGDALIEIVDLRERCIMPTFDPDTAAQNTQVLLDIHRKFEGMLALNARVRRAGGAEVGDEVFLE